MHDASFSSCEYAPRWSKLGCQPPYHLHHHLSGRLSTLNQPQWATYPKFSSAVLKPSNETSDMKRHSASCRPACATMQPRGQRLRPPLHNLLTISPSTSNSILSTFGYQTLCRYAERAARVALDLRSLAREPPPWLSYASCSGNLMARSSFANLPAAMSLPTQYFLTPGEKGGSQLLRR